MKEKLVIVVIAIGIGLFITTIAFLVYQSTKFKPQTDEAQKKVEGTQTQDTTTPTPEKTQDLTIREPKDEAVVDGVVTKLAPDAIQLLKATLTELGECRRMLDAAREREW